MQAWVLSTGDELVRGRTQDTKTGTIARALAAEGVSVIGATLVGDDEADLVEAIGYAADRAELVVMSGGLGPTEDDCTRRAAAAAAGVELERLTDLVENLRRWAERRGRKLSPSNLLQADVPRGAVVLPNRAGSAPGFAVDIGEAWLCALPGPPHELRVVLEEELLPRVRARLGGFDPRVVRTRTIETLGMPEAKVGELLADLMQRGRQAPLGGLARIGTTARMGTIRIVLHAEGVAADVEAALDRAEAQVRERLGAIVYGVDEVPIEQVVGERLLASGTTIATAESCTGGLIAGALTSVAGISAVFPGGHVTYSNEQKTRLLGVPEELFDSAGAVSEEVARAMAEGARAAFGTDLGLAVTGIAGPDGGTDEKPVGLVHMALATTEGTRHRRVVFPGGREFVRTLTVKYALDLVRRQLG